MNPRRALLASGVLLAAVVAGVLAWQAFQMPARVERAPRTINDKMLYVGGWSAAETTRILEAFATLYRSQLPRDFDFKVASGGGVQRVTFPHDLSPWMFFYLVNYANYPKEVEPKGRHVLAAATLTLTPDFELPAQSLYGHKATIYVPAGDTEYNFIYLRIDGGGTWKVPFEEGAWTRVEAPVEPADLPSLLGG